MTVVELLQAAKEKINTPEKWCKGVYARLPNGMPTTSSDKEACTWCMVGALRCVSNYKANDLTLGKAFGVDMVERLFNLNDRGSTTHADVMAAFDKAIALAKQEAA